jgi:tetratricopeptide (TPR) repeat protein
MGALTRPDLPPGAARDLVEALHDLHHRAGRPSLRSLANHVGCSPTTVSSVFSSPRLPTWGVLELVVEALGGDVEEFRPLWLAADSPGGIPSGATPGIAGRRDELRAVRRHLTGGRGLLLVAGEAGIGKSHLARAATSAVGSETFVARGACLPLSTAVPLLPISDVLRAVHGVDDGQWVKDALTDAAPYVEESLLHLLPEIGPGTVDVPSDDAWSRHRQSLAVAAVLAELAALRPLAVVVEDLHWADPATLDLLEHLLAGGSPVPIVGTWRSEDPATTEATADWHRRVSRLPDVCELSLGLLDRDGTAEQLALLGAGTGSADRIHRRSRGQPLFTEQLAAQPEDAPIPGLLADLLDRRLADVDGPAWSAARALGVADRPLEDAVLGRASGLGPAALAAGLHELVDRRLLRPGHGRAVELRHPLLAEAIRRRLLAGELADEHRRLALALAGELDPSPAEVAEHWQRAGDAAEELTWRVAAARAAAGRFAVAQAADEWRRVLALWPEGLGAAGTPPMRKEDVYIEAMESLCFLDVAAGWAIAEAAIRDLPDRADTTAAETYRQAGYIRLWLGDAEGALELIDRAVAIHRERPPSRGYIAALQGRDLVLDGLGRWSEAAESATLARQLASGLEVPGTIRNLLIREAVHESDRARPDTALALLAQAARTDVERPDPGGDIHLALTLTALLMEMGRPVDEVVAAGQRGLESAARWGMEGRLLLMVRANMAAALRLAGQVGRAAALIDPLITDAPPTSDNVSMHAERVCIDAVRGRGEDAVRRLPLVRAFSDPMIMNRMEEARHLGEALLWCDRPEAALHLLLDVLDQALPLDATTGCGAALVVAARAAADLGEGQGDGPRLARAEQLQGLLDGAARYPFTERPGVSTAGAEAAAWAAELARLTGTATVGHWTRASHAWDGLGRPHDAAYSRWRGAQVALATGQGTVAARLLRRAATDARENVPLTAAIAGTGSRTRWSATSAASR